MFRRVLAVIAMGLLALFMLALCVVSSVDIWS